MAISFSINGVKVTVTPTGFKSGSKGKVVKPATFLASLNNEDRKTALDFCKANNLHMKFLPKTQTMIAGRSLNAIYNDLFPSVAYSDLCVVAA